MFTKIFDNTIRVVISVVMIIGSLVWLIAMDPMTVMLWEVTASAALFAVGLVCLYAFGKVMVTDIVTDIVDLVKVLRAPKATEMTEETEEDIDLDDIDSMPDESWSDPVTKFDAMWSAKQEKLVLPKVASEEE